MENNEPWANNIIRRWDRSFKPRWIVFNEMLTDLQNPEHNCLDIGCGNVSELGENLKFKLKMGTDLIVPKKMDQLTIPFIQSNLYHLPFKDKSFHLILLRFVVEHIENPKSALDEINRILKPNGSVLILTTNICSPFIYLPKLLPYTIRKKLIMTVFGAGDDDIFPTYHRMNTKYSFKKYAHLFGIIEWKYIQDVNWNRKWIFRLLFFWHILTRLRSFQILRNNIVTLLKSAEK